MNRRHKWAVLVLGASLLCASSLHAYPPDVKLPAGPKLADIVDTITLPGGGELNVHRLGVEDNVWCGSCDASYIPDGFTLLGDTSGLPAGAPCLDATLEISNFDDGVDPNDNYAWINVSHGSQWALAAPEPSAFALLCMGTAGLLAFGRRRARKR